MVAYCVIFRAMCVQADGLEDEATIRFTPSAGDPETQYADEVFYPHPGRKKPSQMDSEWAVIIIIVANTCKHFSKHLRRCET